MLWNKVAVSVLLCLLSKKKQKFVDLNKLKKLFKMQRMKRLQIKKLSHDETVELINLYRERESLWNIHSEEYRNLEQKHQDLSDIASIMGTTESQVKLKLRALRSTYLMEAKKVEESKNSNIKPEHIYVPSLSWFQEMQFLNDCIIRRHSLPTPTAKKFKKSTQIKVIPMSPIDKSAMLDDDDAPCSTQLEKAIQTLLELNNQKVDTMDTFGQSIAAQLKELPTEHAYTAMAEIQNIIVEKKLLALNRKKT